MLKVFLVDDELLVRLGVKSVVDWEKHGFLYAGDAPDGEQALVEIERIKPDIVLTDIVMPNMNGLELIEIVQKRFPAIRIIVLSSHNEYEYVRKAMKMGVDDYMLKTSMKPQELLELLRETARKIAESGLLTNEGTADGHRSGEEKRKEIAASIRSWIDRHPDAKAEPLNDILASPNQLLLLRIHGDLRTSPDGQPEQTLTNLLELELKKWTSGRVIPYTDREWIIFAALEDAPLDLPSIGHDLLSACKKFLNVTASIGSSGSFSEPEQLRSAYEQASAALRSYFYEGRGKVYAADRYPANERAVVPFSDDDAKELKLLIERVDEEGIRAAVSSVMDRLYERRGTVESNIQVLLELHHMFRIGFKPYMEEGSEGDRQSPVYKQILAFEELDEARVWFDERIGQCCAQARKAIGESCREEIHQLMMYMKTNLAEDLSLKRASEMLRMSESYVSFLFKKETGTSFTEYVSRIRVEKAAELLVSTNRPSYLIAEQVGYDNINYFGRVFKKVMGVSPQQYRSQYQKKVT